MALSKWLLKNGKKAAKGVGSAVDDLLNSKAATGAVKKVKEGAGKITKGIKDADVAGNVSEAVGKAGSAADKFIKKNPRKAALGAGAAGAAAGVAADASADGDEPMKKKKKRPYLED